MKTETTRKKLTMDALNTTLEGLCQVYDKTMTPVLLELWQRMLSDFYEDEFHRAIKSYLIGRDGGFMPKPGQIYALARPEGDRESEASLMVEHMHLLLGTCGGDRDGVARAQSKLTEIGWAYVENMGGWSRFASEMQLIDEGDVLTAKSQARKAIMGLIDRKKSGKTLLLGKETDGPVSLSAYAKNLLPAPQE